MCDWTELFGWPSNRAACIQLVARKQIGFRGNICVCVAMCNRASTWPVTLWSRAFCFVLGINRCMMCSNTSLGKTTYGLHFPYLQLIPYCYKKYTKENSSTVFHTYLLRFVIFTFGKEYVLTNYLSNLQIMQTWLHISMVQEKRSWKIPDNM